MKTLHPKTIALVPTALIISPHCLVGSLVTGDGFFRVYNSLNQLWKVYNESSTEGQLLQAYVYHPVEERVLIKNITNPDGIWKETVYYVNENLVRTVNSSGAYDTVYAYHEGQLIAEETNGIKKFYHPDHLGSTTVVTDESGNVLENTSYSPYGVILSGGESSRYDYEGKEYDSLTGSYDFHFRMQGIGGAPPFGQPDSILQNVYDPQLLNRYSYVRNNPYKYIDPTGHIITFTNWVKRMSDRISYEINQFSESMAQAWNQVPGHQWISGAYDASPVSSAKTVIDWGANEAFYQYSKDKTLKSISEEGMNQKREDALFAAVSLSLTYYSGMSGKLTITSSIDAAYSFFTGENIWQSGYSSTSNFVSNGILTDKNMRAVISAMMYYNDVNMNSIESYYNSRSEGEDGVSTGGSGQGLADLIIKIRGH